jgi:hypothetical protein
LNNLGRVGVPESAHEEGVLLKARAAPLHGTGNDEHRLDRAEAPVIMLLFGEKVLQQAVKSVELARKNLGRHEAFGHEHVLANQDEIRNHDGHGAEQSLESLGKRGAAKVSRVHGNEGAVGGIELRRANRVAESERQAKKRQEKDLTFNLSIMLSFLCPFTFLP